MVKHRSTRLVYILRSVEICVDGDGDTNTDVDGVNGRGMVLKGETNRSQRVS